MTLIYQQGTTTTETIRNKYQNHIFCIFFKNNVLTYKKLYSFLCIFSIFLFKKNKNLIWYDHHIWWFSHFCLLLFVLYLDYIAKYGRLSERAARHKFWQILSAVEFCHNKGIVHRDLKVSGCIFLSDIKNFKYFNLIKIFLFHFRLKIFY